MALTRCSECGHQISSLAAACPSCGAPPAGTSILQTRVAAPKADGRSQSRGKLIIAGALTLAIVVVASLIETPATDQAPAAASAPSAAADGPVSGPVSLATLAPPPPPPVADMCAEYSTVHRVDSLTPVILNQQGQFGDRMHGKVESCRFYARENIARLRVTLTWAGAFTSKPYALEGDLTLSDTAWAFTAGSGNENLSELELNQKKTIGAIGLLALLAAATADTDAPAASPSRRHVCLTNDATIPIQFFWKSTNGSNTWTADSIGAGSRRSWWTTGTDSLLVNFNRATSTSVDRIEYRLPHNRYTECTDSRGFYFTTELDTIVVRVR